MSRRGWAVASLGGVGTYRLPEGNVRTAIREHFDIRAFGVNAYTAEAGRAVIEEHDEVQALAAGHQELYVVLEGDAAFTLDSETFDAPAGTLVFVGEPTARRSATAESAGTTVLVVGAPAAEAYAVSPWEDMAGFFDFYRRRDYAGAVAYLEGCLGRNPGYPGALFNLACVESLAGRADDALEHLRAALEAEPKLRENARDDDDLATVRADPRFEELVG